MKVSRGRRTAAGRHLVARCNRPEADLARAREKWMWAETPEGEIADGSLTSGRELGPGESFDGNQLSGQFQEHWYFQKNVYNKPDGSLRESTLFPGPDKSKFPRPEVDTRPDHHQLGWNHSGRKSAFADDVAGGLKKWLQKWEYDESLSNQERAVWYNKEDGKVHVAHRGSTTRDDWVKHNVTTVVGQRGQRYERMKSTYMAAHHKYPNAVIEGSGGSLGGAQVYEAVSTYGSQPWFGHHTAFNPLTSPFQRTRLRMAAMGQGEEAARTLASKLTTIQHQDDIATGLGGIPYGERLKYNAPAKNAMAAHSTATFDGIIGDQGEFVSRSFVAAPSAEQIAQQRAGETVEGLWAEQPVKEGASADSEGPEQVTTPVVDIDPRPKCPWGGYAPNGDVGLCENQGVIDPFREIDPFRRPPRPVPPAVLGGGSFSDPGSKDAVGPGPPILRMTPTGPVRCAVSTPRTFSGAGLTDFRQNIMRPRIQYM